MHLVIASVQFQQPGIDHYKAYSGEMKVNGSNRFPPTNELKPSFFMPVYIYGVPAQGKDLSFNIALADLIPYPKQGEDRTRNYVALFKIMQK